MGTELRFEFHIARKVRQHYQFDDALFSYTGNVVFADFHAARLFAQKMNARRNLARFPEQAIHAGQINAMGLIDEILHMVIEQYRREKNRHVMEDALAWLEARFGKRVVEETLQRFCEEFPTLAVYRGEADETTYLAGVSLHPDGYSIPNRQIVLEEILLLWLANQNPAFKPFIELFDDTGLDLETPYRHMIDSLHDFFDSQPYFGPGYQNLIDMLRAPALASPNSLAGQLEFLRSHWKNILIGLILRLLSGADFIKEEEKVFMAGPGPAEVIEFKGLEAEPERFSPDRDWMPNLVLMAKNIYVWLDQLSKQYGRSITRLDEIPDEVLLALSRAGITGLWLIGIWERSPASKTIKQRRGNPEAVASAYSLFSYDIAADLGGDEAYQVLAERAWLCGIRLASDMVPNHMGIDSRWVIEHPDWFISLDQSPFPTYTFNGPDLSWDGRVGIYLEDHYYNSTDAAVVFKRVDHWTGSAKYIYHGNDGTSMPWNDTAQLNYLIPEVREAVIQTILHVARKFPVIRFDAAMTLAKRHYQRLWFPEPGSGGDIPSRAEFGMTREQFNAVFPEEFWREVVDRVAHEAPDTLLLAEAFWLMEGYFVRSLGMHRVYNSAFMNMLRDEKNQEYRLVIKNTLEFEPEVLKRYVNFMNNPDERTAVDQFGKGDKYFGVCTLLATMPGLPMIGHGQIEGYNEKYGMEFRRAYWDEQPDAYLVERHDQEIFPLLRRRYLFADVQDFLLYDFRTPANYVNEDVFAYSNRAGDERALILYNNKYAETSGWVHTSVAYLAKTGNGDERALVQRSLADGLGITDDPLLFLVFRDQVTGLEYIRNCHELRQQGLYIQLGAYQRHVFLDFREIRDTDAKLYQQLMVYLKGRGVANIEDAMREMYLEPLHISFGRLVNAGFFQWLIANRYQEDGTKGQNIDQALEEADQKNRYVFREVIKLTAGAGNEEEYIANLRRELTAVLSLPTWTRRLGEHSAELHTAISYLLSGPGESKEGRGANNSLWGALFCWVFTHRLADALGRTDWSDMEAEIQSWAWADEWLLKKISRTALKEMGMEHHKASRILDAMHLVCCLEEWQSFETHQQALQNWFTNDELLRFLGVNRHQDILWFKREAFLEFLWWLFAIWMIKRLPQWSESSEIQNADAVEKREKEIITAYRWIEKLRELEEKSGYQVEKLLTGEFN